MIRMTGMQNVASFTRELDLALAAMDRALSQKFEDWTKKVLYQIASTTPQFTGDLASAWNYSVDQPNYYYTPSQDKLGNVTYTPSNRIVPRQRGDFRAIEEAVSKAAGTHPTWRDVVYLTNPADIAPMVERQTVLIRPVNLVDGRVAMVQYYVDKFNRGDLGP